VPEEGCPAKGAASRWSSVRGEDPSLGSERWEEESGGGGAAGVAGFAVGTVVPGLPRRPVFTFLLPKKGEYTRGLKNFQKSEFFLKNGEAFGEQIDAASECL